MTDLVEELARAIIGETTTAAVAAILPIIRRREIEAATKMREGIATTFERATLDNLATHVRTLDPATIIGDTA